MLRLLGPLDMSHCHQTVRLGGPRQQTVLAMLALNVGQVTSTDQLIKAVWGEEPPSTSRAQVQACVSALRKVFARVGQPDAIQTRGPGYTLALDGRMVDSWYFEDVLTTAARQIRAGHVSDAVDTLRTALDLWRGPALLGIESELVRRAATRLDEKRLMAVEERVQLELRLGLHERLTIELPALIAEHPFRERLYGFLMRALYRCGRQTEALGVFRKARVTLLEEAGVEPGQELHDLEWAILNQDPELDPPPGTGTALSVSDADRPEPTRYGRVMPRQIPASITDFTGWSLELARIRRLALDGTGAGTASAMPIAVLSGLGGSGKSTMAIRTAHELSPHFKDGVLYADFQGPGTQDCFSHLGRFLRALGIPAREVPGELTERSALFRSCLAVKNVLVVLDGVTREEEILHLLPGGSQCMVIVTSRRRLMGLPGAHHIDVPPLSVAESRELLTRIVGADRVDREPHATTELSTLCGGLPLALRIAGTKLRSRSHWTIGRFVDRLEDGSRCLDHLRHQTWDLCSVLDSAYEGLGERERRLFRLLAVPDDPRISARTAAALMETDTCSAEDLLEVLHNACLLEAVHEQCDVGGHYRLRGLVRVYAHERLVATETREEREAARLRTLRVRTASVVLAPSPPASGEASQPAWPLRQERTRALT